MAHISSLRAANSSTKHYLPFSPQHLTVLDILYVILLILIKHTLNFFHLAPPLQISQDRTKFLLPDLTLSAPLQITNADLEAWDRAVACSYVFKTPQRKLGLKNRDTSTTHSVILPVALTTPLLALLLAHPKNPILPFGSVNTKNRFEFRNPSACRNLPSILKQKKLMVVARVGGPDLLGRRVKRGMEFDTVVEIVDLDGDESRVLFRQTVSTLQFLSAEREPTFQPQSLSSEVGKLEGKKVMDEMERVSEKVTLDVNAPRRWARVCKDYNPIHMSRLAAKLFGFPRKIAHGNHVIALATERMRDEKQVLSRLWWDEERASYLEVVFRRPAFLPAEMSIFVDAASEAREEQSEFEIRTEGKVNITGKAGWL